MFHMRHAAKNKLIINCYRDMSRAVKNSVIVHTIAIMKIPKFIVTLFLNRTLCFLLQIMSLLMPFVASLRYAVIFVRFLHLYQLGCKVQTSSKV